MSEFIEQFKLSNEEKLKLYKSIEKIKFTEITPENIKDNFSLFPINDIFVTQLKY